MNVLGSILRLDFAKGWRFYGAAILFVAVYAAGYFGLPIAQFGFDLTPDDPMTVVPEPGTALIYLLGALGIYEKAKVAATK